MDASSQSPSSPSSASASKIDPVLPNALRNAVRYTITAKEYDVLHQYLMSHAPAVKKRTPRPPRYEAIVHSRDDYNAATVRASLRVFVASATCLKLWDVIQARLFARGKPKQ